MKKLITSAAVAFIAASAFAQPALDPHALAGLWAARNNSGPDVRGVLTIVREGNDWLAEIAGRSAPVTIENDRVSFQLPAGEGRFRGRTNGQQITGHWIQPNATGSEYATPVTLAKHAPHRWQGVVSPIDAHMTLFLPVKWNDDGTLSAYVRNPERNVGRFLDVQRLTVDGHRVNAIGKNNKVVATGNYDADNETLSMYFDSIGSTFDFHRATAADEAAFYTRGKNPAPYVYHAPIARDDGWPVASLDAVNISRDDIAKFINMIVTMPIESVHSSDIHAFLMARHGKLVVEEYFHATNPDEPHDTRSAAKSITSVMTGAAVLRGDPISTSTHVYEAMYGAAAAASQDERKRAITVENLLTMSSGLDCDDNDDNSPGREDTMQEQTAQPDWYRFTLDLKMIRNPGEKPVYCSCQPNLLGGVLGRTTKRWLPDLFRDTVATPMHIRQYGMNLTPTGDAYMGGGMRLRPRDFLKVGQMMIDGGRWEGRRIVSEKWTKRSTAAIYELGGNHYGYLWWITDYPYRGRTVRAFFAGGNGGQIVMGIPELDLVIAFFGGNYSDSSSLVPQRVFVPQYVLPAVK
jgi:CubicO group peptidase (beta-lactamase class C family)